MADTPVLERLAVAEEATRRLVEALAGVGDEWCRDPSRLPGWSRGHVLTHLARNADALDRLATAAVEGRSTTMYGPEGTREAEIEAGAGRPADELVDDVRTSAERLARTCRGLPEHLWDVVTEWRAGRREPLREIPVARLVEVELHRFDLDAGYAPADWPDASTDLLLGAALARLAGAPAAPMVRLLVDGEDQPRGSDDPEAVTVSGPGPELVTWLTGRGDGRALRCDGPLPGLPSAWT